ncbi:MAG: hypothetical protein HKO68_20630 [Desulfobacterales bacterium]|nr:hypothetical protein [Desulfobacterales bacterium]
MTQQRSPIRLAKFIDYILSRRPDEFGLVTNNEGFVKIKELLKAVNEEEGLKYVRRSHINEILITLPEPSFELADNLIRAKHRDQLPKHAPAVAPPKLLYTCVRKKAHPFVMDKGIWPTSYSQVILSSNRDLATRIGKRADQSAVLLTVQVIKANDKGVVFIQAGESIFLSDFIPSDCFTGPPLPKEKPVTKKEAKQETPQMHAPAGSFFIDLAENVNPKTSETKSKRRVKKNKPRRERPPWRR